MAELPKYVRCVIKGNDREFYYFHKYRGTEYAWPMIALPHPFDKEFGERVAICQALKCRSGEFFLGEVPLPDLGSEQFWPEAKNVFSGATDGAKTFRNLIKVFRNHTAYTKLAASTKRSYDTSADMVLASWADDPVEDMTAVDAQQAIDCLKETPAVADAFRSFLSRLISFGVPRGFRKDNPIEFTEKLNESEPWTPWPDWAFALFFKYAWPELALPVVSALFTGQRQSDVLAMPRPKASDMTIPVRAQKTGEIVWIPVHSEYRRWIAAAPVADAVQLHLGKARSDGPRPRARRPYTGNGYRTEWRKLMALKIDGKLVFERFREERIVFHGIRKNAVVALLEAGCTEAQVGAIVNMSEQMVRHYGRDVRVKALARDGMALLESRWAELRPASLPRT